MNKVILAGRLTKDPEVRYTQTGVAVASFTLAVNRRFSKEKVADFIPIVVWDKIAEIVGNNLVKGSQVLIEGRIQIRSYDAQDGSKRYVTEVIALWEVNRNSMAVLYQNQQKLLVKKCHLMKRYPFKRKRNYLKAKKLNKNSWLDSFKRGIAYKLSKKGYKLIRFEIK